MARPNRGKPAQSTRRTHQRIHAPGVSKARGPRPEARQVPLRPGQKATLTFRAMNLEGAGLARLGQQLIAVPFALPGEEAVVEITRGGRLAEGKIVALVRKSVETAAPRCRHFGVCGGCQWQHLPYDAQLQHKTQLVRSYLESTLRDVPMTVREAAGADPWEYRNRIQAAFAVRQDRVVAGYYTLRQSSLRPTPPRLGSGRAGVPGEELRVINVQECPIQHNDNVAMLHAARDTIAALGWPIYDREIGRGLVRGAIGQVGFYSGEGMLVLCTTRDVPDRMAFVRAMRDRLPNLTSLLLSIQPAHTPELLGRIQLLWGREYLNDEVAGLRLHLYASAAVPPNPKAMPFWLEAIAHAVVADGVHTVADAACEEGLVPLALAQRVGRVVGVAPDRVAMHRAWENAGLNGIDNCVFYTRAPAAVLAKLRSRGERFDAMLVTPRGEPTAPEVFVEAKEAGVRRIACAGHSLALLVADLRAAMAAGYRPGEVQPVDLLPQTSRIHCIATLERQG